MPAFKFFIAVPLMVSSACLAADPPAPTFCERLAPQLGMRPDMVVAPGGRGAAVRAEGHGWHLNIAGGLRYAFLGGNPGAVSLDLEPIDENSIQEFKRLRDACGPVADGATCNVEGPARMVIGTKRGKVSEEAVAGEHAEVGMHRTMITCQDKHAV